MEKMYTAEEVITILVGECNNFCAWGVEAERKPLTDFALYVLKQKPTTLCERENHMGKQVLENLRTNGTLFEIKNK